MSNATRFSIRAISIAKNLAPQWLRRHIAGWINTLEIFLDGNLKEDIDRSVGEGKAGKATPFTKSKE